MNASGPMTPVFTLEQYQKLLALIGTPSSPLDTSVQQTNPLTNAMANVVSSNASSMAIMALKHLVFSTQVVNRRAYNSNTWVIDTGATDHIVCSAHLLTSITAITQSMVQLPNGETASVTDIGTVILSPCLTLYNVLCVPFFTFSHFSVSSFTQVQPHCLVLLSTYCFIQDLIT